MNILLIQLKRIGDLILTTPAIAAVRAQFPSAHLALVASPACRELLPAIPGVDRKFISGGNLMDLRILAELLRRRYDVCVDFTGNDRSSFLTLCSRARQRITSKRMKRSRARFRMLGYNTWADAEMRLVHTVNFNLDALQPLGIHDASPELILQLPERSEEAAEHLMQSAIGGREFVIFHPGSARAEKYWDAQNWAELIRYAAGGPQLQCVLTGGKSRMERDHIQELKLTAKNPVIDLTGRLHLLTLAALIRRARLLVAVDSAPVHLAAAMGTPQVALFGPTNPFHWRPRNQRAVVIRAGQPAPLTSFEHNQPPAPMNQISTAQVIGAMEALLSAPAAHPV